MRFYRGDPFKAGIGTVVALGVIVLLALAINVSFGIPFNLSLFPPGQDYSVKAAFSDANGVSRGADVVIAGHTVGQVTGVEAQGTQAVVTMRVASHYAPLHQATTARIRYSTLLAQKYVEISPATGGPEVQSGGSLRAENAISPVDFDQFLSALDPQTRQQLQILIQQAGGSLDGQHATINDLLVQLRGLSQESRAPLSTFSAHNADLDRILANLGVVSSRLAESRQQLGDLVVSMDTVTGTLARNDQALAALIAHLGNVMGDFDATLAGNEQNLHNTVVGLDPMLVQLNGTLGYVAGDTRTLMGQFPANTDYLSPETVSAVSQPGSDGQGHVLRQLFVISKCDQPDAPPSCRSTATQASTPAVTLPTLPSLKLPLCIPTPSPPKLPNGSLAPLPCPSISAPALPTPSCMPATPKPPKLPTPTPSISCPSLPPLPGLPIGEVIPDWLALLLGANP